MLDSRFPLTFPSGKHPFATWLAYALHRTDLSDPIVLHALHLLVRLSRSFEATPPTAEQELYLHHRFMTASLSLCCSCTFLSPPHLPSSSS